MEITQTHDPADPWQVGQGISVRAAIPKDSPVWLRMRHRFWPEVPAEIHQREIAAFFAGEVAEPEAVFLAFDAAGAAVGFAELSLRQTAEGCSSDRVAYLEAWYVERAARRNGVGRALIWAAESWALSQGCSEFASDTPLDDHEGAHAHRALGFTETAQIRCFHKTL